MSVKKTEMGLLDSSPAIALTALVSLLLAVFDYGGMADHYVYLYTALQFPEIAAADPYLRDSFFKFSSLFYPLNEYLRIQDREWIVFGFFLVSVVGGCLLVLRLLQRQFSLEPWAAALVVILLLLVDRKILPNAWPVIMPMHPGSPSMLTNILAVIVIYLLFEKRPLAAAIALLGLHFIATKENVLLLPSAILFAIWCKDLGWRRAIYFLIPFGYLAYMALSHTRIEGSPEAVRELMRYTVETELGDGNFLFHDGATNIAFLSSLAGLSFLARPFPPHIRALVWAFSLTAIGLWLVNVVHLGFFMEALPIPQLVFIGPVRSMKFVIFLFYMVATVRVFKAEGLFHHEKAGLLLALYGLTPHSLSALLLAVLVTGVAFLPRWIAADGPSTLANLAERLNQKRWVWPETVAVLLFVGSWVYATGHYGFRWDDQAFKNTGRWSSIVQGKSAADWGAYEAERKKPMYQLLAIYKSERGVYVSSLELPAHARKAAFSADSFAGFGQHPTLNYFAEVNRRKAARRDILARLNAGQRIEGHLKEFLASRGVKVMSPIEVADKFGSVETVDYGDVRLLTFR
jgi:hypothetical protein